jgi:hypothetical protein
MVDSNAARLSRIRTYLLVALIFEVLAIVGFGFGEKGTIGGLIAVSTSSVPPIGVGAYYRMSSTNARIVSTIHVVRPKNSKFGD